MSYPYSGGAYCSVSLVRAPACLFFTALSRVSLTLVLPCALSMETNGIIFFPFPKVLADHVSTVDGASAFHFRAVVRVVVI